MTTCMKLHSVRQGKELASTIKITDWKVVYAAGSWTEVAVWEEPS
jgi:hypothetical protein